MRPTRHTSPLHAPTALRLNSVLSLSNSRLWPAQTTRSSSPLTRDAGDSFSEATNLGRLSPRDQRRRSGKVDRRDSDFYRVTLRERADIAVKISNREVSDRESLVASVFDGKRRLLDSSTVRPGREVRLFVNNARSGTYFVRLTTNGRNVDFRLQLTLGEP